MVEAVKGHILLQLTKFYKDRSNCYGDIAIFVIFQDGGRRHFGFSKFEILTLVRCKRPICVTVPNFVKIGQTTAHIWRFNVFFSKWRPYAHLGFLGRLLGPPTTTTWWSLSLCKKFGWNRRSSFDNMKLSIFCPFGLQTPIHAPKLGFWEYFSPKMGEQY